MTDHRLALLAPLAVGLTGMACALGQPTVPAENLSPPTVEIEAVQVEAQAQAPAEATTAPAPVQTPLLVPRNCAANLYDPDMWCLLGPQGPQDITPPDGAQFQDYAPATNRALIQSHFPDEGVGPGNKAASDLWVFDLNTGQAQPIITTNTMIQARWAPNGQDFAYLNATDTSYELRWQSGGGEDRLLASDATFVFAFSPDGGEVAFTREPDMMDVGSREALFVVTVASGAEREIAPIDTSGGGSITDVPMWSPDGATILLHVSSATGGPRGMLRAAADGSGAAVLTIDPSLADQPGGDDMPWLVMWHPDGRHLLATPPIYPGFATYYVVQYELDPALERVTGLEVLAEDAELLGWDVPGQSVWIMPSAQDLPPGTIPQSLPLP